MTKSFFTYLLLASMCMAPAGSMLFAQQYMGQINKYLSEAKTQYDLAQSDIENWKVSDQYTDRKTGLTYTYLQQEINGVPIFNAISTMALRNDQVVHFASRFWPNALANANAQTPSRSAEQAIADAAAHLGLAKPLALRQTARDGNRYVFTDGGIAKRPIRVELYYQPVENRFHLAWNVIIDVKDSPDWWNVRVDAHTGEFLEKNNWNLSCQFGESHSAGYATDGPVACQHNHRQDASADGAYLVFPLPLEAPSFGPRSQVIDPESPTASPYGWHDTDGVNGPEYTITRGNNVYAYEDLASANQPGYSPDGGPNLNFSFPLDLALDPVQNQDASITNLFYMNNILHDILYLHGFTEEAGNFQENNYGRGGEGNDFVEAEALDGGGTNNANFATPDDGGNGRMQMYLWPSGDPVELRINMPSTIAGDYGSVSAVFGPGVSSPITANLVLVDDGSANGSQGCTPLVNAAAIAGNIALIDRGNCTFVEKVQAAEAAGAIAAVVINNTGGNPITMGGNGTVNIPSVMITLADGNLIKNELATGATLNATLALGGSGQVARDGSFDNGIIAHEYGHGVSNRLTGGPSNSGCLFNGEQGGEGWSDWLALIMTIEPNDAGADRRGIGTYAIIDTNNNGIRRFPYSTNMSVNPQTYGSLAQSNGVHQVGEIWAQAIWDLTWSLIDAEGFDADWFNGQGGNHTALTLVLEGMRLQPCGPGYVDARDAILKADELLYNNAHRCLIWNAFARRGFGVNALQGSPGTAGDEVEDFTLPTFCQIAVAPPTAGFTVDVQANCFGVFQFQDASSDTPQEWLWDFGDGNTSNSINPTHTYSQPGVYTVTLVVNNTLGSDTSSLTVNYETLPTPQVTGATELCQGSSTTLESPVAPGAVQEWRENGMVIGTGSTLVLDNPQASTLITVKQFEDKPLQQIGPADNSIGNGGNHNTGFDGRLLFEAYAPFTLKSVKVYAQGTDVRTIRLFDGANNLVQSLDVLVPDGESRVTLNFDVPVPGLYSLSNVSQNLYRNNNGANYPYEIAGLCRIYSSSATTNPANFYYYFYDWEIQEKGCESVETDVEINVSAPSVDAAFSASAANQQVAFTDQSTGNPSVWQWDFGDNTGVSNEQNPVYTYASDGIYTVTLIAGDGICNDTIAQTVAVLSSSVNQTPDAYALRVFPNPASETLNLEMDAAEPGNRLLEIFDARGSRVYLYSLDGPANRHAIPVGNLANGVYLLKLSGEKGYTALKFAVMH